MPGRISIVTVGLEKLGSSRAGRRDVISVASVVCPGAPSPGEAAPGLLPVADGHTARGASR